MILTFKRTFTDYEVEFVMLEDEHGNLYYNIGSCIEYMKVRFGMEDTYFDSVTKTGMWNGTETRVVPDTLFVKAVVDFDDNLEKL